MTHSRSPPQMARNLRVACALRLLVRTRPRESAQKRAWTPRGAGAETHRCYHQPRQSDLISHRPQVCGQRFVYRSASSWVTERIPARCTTTSQCAASGGSAELRFELTHRLMTQVELQISVSAHIHNAQREEPADCKSLGRTQRKIPSIPLQLGLHTSPSSLLCLSVCEFAHILEFSWFGCRFCSACCHAAHESTKYGARAPPGRRGLHRGAVGSTETGASPAAEVAGARAGALATT